MSTNVTTTTIATATAPVAVLNPSPKLTTSVASLLDAQIKVQRKFESMVEQAKADQAEFSYNRDQCRAVLQAAFRAAYTKMGEQSKLTGDALKAHVEAGMKRSGTDISKALTLAFPKDESATVELQKAVDAGLGINAQLEVARGNTTVAAIQAERANKAAGAQSETARPPSGDATANKPTVQPPTPEAPATSKLTPKERFVMQLLGAIKFGTDLKLTLEEMSELATDTFADQAAIAAEKANEGK